MSGLGPQLEAALGKRLAELQPVIEGIVRRKLRVTLSAEDGRRENQEALDLCAQIQLELFDELRRDEAQAIRDSRGYTAVLCYRACADYWRAKRPERTSLANQVRYFLSHQPAFAVWEAADGDLLCGLSAWRERKEGTIAAERLRRMDERRRANLPRKARPWMKPEDWDQLMRALFEVAQAPVPLDELITIVAEVLEVRDVLEDSADELIQNRRAASTADPLVVREMLQRLWVEILQLRPRQRCAYLLNFRDGELEVFPENGIASITEIGACLALTNPQFVCLWRELPLDEQLRLIALALRTEDEKFTFVWNYLPLDDLLIAQLLEATRQQVINLRKVARERILQQMSAYAGGKF